MAFDSTQFTPYRNSSTMEELDFYHQIISINDEFLQSDKVIRSQAVNPSQEVNRGAKRSIHQLTNIDNLVVQKTRNLGSKLFDRIEQDA